MEPLRAGRAAVLVALVALSAGCLGTQPGGSAFTTKDFASGDRYPKLVVEIDSVAGAEPVGSAVSLLKTRIAERLNKPGGVTYDEQTITSSRTVYSADDLRTLERANRNHQAAGDTMALYVLFVDGHSDQDTTDGQVLGVQYSLTSFAVFKDTIRDSSGLVGRLFGTDSVEQAVLVHEFGHTIGLVNNGIAMVNNHEDAQHPRHSSSSDSVMYWAVENTLGFDELANSIPNQFDANDIADIQAAGGR